MNVLMVLITVMLMHHVRTVLVHLIVLVTLDMLGMAQHVLVCLLSINDIYLSTCYRVVL